MSALSERDLVLALNPFSRGISFTVFESSLSPIDWGIKRLGGHEKNARSFVIAQQLMDRYQPDVLALGDSVDPHRRRSKRIHRLQRLIISHAEGQAVEIISFSRKEVRQCFGSVGAKTRYEIAQAIASRIQAFETRLPKARKLWTPEDVRMSLFDAASLALTYYYLHGGVRFEPVSTDP